MNRQTLLLLWLVVLPFSTHAASNITVEQNQLTVDGRKQPQLYGAEVQYFRMRGGYGANVPREKVIALWNQELDQLVAAKMNAVSFYIPWDFHEYAEGKFDFNGTADEDGDGQADYPSRDVVTFIRLIEEHGIHHILVRPGPYINAEWGFLGFGAVPEWFHNEHPESHMQNSSGLKTRLYDYHNPDFLKKTRTWFSAVYEQVLKKNIGPGRPIDFIQIDNETNYLWDSIYHHDYSPSAVMRYRTFLKSRYEGNIARVNEAHYRHWRTFDEIQAPTQPDLNLGEDQDWYRYHDESIHSYLIELRRIWEDLGVREPHVLFTLAESYNAADHGLLPNYLYRNDRSNTGLMTVNLYPKTFEREDQPLLNNPFKADLDVKATSAANAAYWGSHQDWAMGPEIQGGWWKGIEVSEKARQQTYLTVIGHGLKAFFVYYFNEGDNFGVHWAYDRASTLYADLRLEEKVPKSCPITDLPGPFWNELQARMNQSTAIGFDPKYLVQEDAHQAEKLFFDAALDGDLNPRDHYFGLKKIGTQVIAPYRHFLGRSLEIQDDVALVKDTENHVPSREAINSLSASADWSGGLLGYLLNSNINPQILIGDNAPASDFNRRLLVHIDTGNNAKRTLSLLSQSLSSGHSVLNLLGDQLAKELGYPGGRPAAIPPGDARVELNAYPDQDQGTLSELLHISANHAPLFVYSPTEITAAHCKPILFTQDGQIAGYSCLRNKAVFIQLGALIFDEYNTSDYGKMTDATPLKQLMQSFAQSAGILPQLQLSPTADRVVAFGRKDPERKVLWITVKSGSKKSQHLQLQISPQLLRASVNRYRITNLLNKNDTRELDAATLSSTGFAVEIEAEDSSVYVVESSLAENPNLRFRPADH